MGIQHLVQQDTYIQARSTTSLLIGLGSKTIVLTRNIVFPVANTSVTFGTVTLDAGSGKNMSGTVTSYSPATMTLVVNITAVTGAGTFTSWTIGCLATWHFADQDGYLDRQNGIYYQGRLTQPLVTKRQAFTSGSTGANGGASVSRILLDGGQEQEQIGAVIYTNLATEKDAVEHPAGELDPFLDYRVDGQQQRHLLVDHDGVINTAVALATVICLNPSVDVMQVTMTVGSLLQKFSYLKLQPNRYQGTNVGSTGVDGTTSDQGKPRPKGWGRFVNKTPFQANANIPIYELLDGPMTVTGFYDGGAPLGVGVTQTSLAALLSTSPASGTWDVYSGAGGTKVRVNRLNKAPTFDGYTGNGTTDCTPAQVFKQIFTGPGGLAAAAVSAADITALDLLVSTPVDLYFPDDVTIKEALDRAAMSAGAWYGEDSSGLVRLKQLVAPLAAASVARLRRFDDGDATLSTDGDIIDIRRAAASDQGGSIPSFRASLNHSPNGTRQQVGDLQGDPAVQTDIVGGLARRNFLRRDFVTTPATDAVVGSVPNGMTPEMVFTSYLQFATVSNVAQVTGGLVVISGSGYGGSQALTISAPAGGGTQAVGFADIAGITAYTGLVAGTGYFIEPTLSISTSTGSGFVGRAVINNGGVSDIVISDPGMNYAPGDLFVFTGPCSTVASATMVIGAGGVSGSITRIRITVPGTTYTAVPTMTVPAPGGAGVQATMTANIAKVVVTVNTAGALAEATRRLNLYNVRRDLWEITVNFSIDVAAVIDLGSVVTLRMNRFNAFFGRPLLVLGIQYDPVSLSAILTCWG